MSQKIRGIDYVTIEIFGINQGYMDSEDECKVLIEEKGVFKDFEFEVLQHRKGTGFIDVALYPKNGDIRKFIKDIKKYGYVE